MEFKKILEYIYPISEYRELKRENPRGFLITIIIPLGLLFFFFYFYFYPFGYNKNINFSNEDILNKERASVYLREETVQTKGLTGLIYDPVLPIRNPYITVSIEGEGVSLLPEIIDIRDVSDIWDYEITSFDFEEDRYSIIRDYSIKDSNILSFYIKWQPRKEEGSIPLDTQLLFKYNNIRIIQNIYSLELRIDEVYNEKIYTYKCFFPIGDSFYNTSHELVATYEKSKYLENGFIELIVDGYRVGRQVIISPYNLFDDYENLQNLRHRINTQLEKDLTQENISLGQEIYRIELEREIPKNIRNSVDIYSYYMNKYKPKSDSTLLLSEYYEKTFYNYFQGDIYELRIGYEYPFKEIKRFAALYPITPLSIAIVGNSENIKEINLHIQRDPIWKKLINF